MTINNVGTLEIDDILDRWQQLDEQEKSAQAGKDEIKQVLDQMRKEGSIGKKVEHPNFIATLETRTSWKFTKAVKEKQDMEKLDGSATQSESTFWRIRPNKPSNDSE